MPELPEVETIRRDLERKILAKKITSVEIFSSKSASHNAAFFVKTLVGRKFRKIERRGKLLIFILSSRSSDLDRLLIHLKMTGQLIYIDKKTQIAGGHSLSSNIKDLPNKYTRAVFSFTSGGKLFFNDLRKFGYLKLATEKQVAELLKKNYGPEPLQKDFSLSFFIKLLEGKKTRIKALLLDQKRIAGLGNIYVDESLWAARIKPTRLAGSLKKEEIKKLWQSINRIIKEAIKYRGTSFSNYVDTKGKQGNYSSHLKVYGQRDRKCPNCGRPIKKARVAGRGTHYCPYCQK